MLLPFLVLAGSATLGRIVENVTRVAIWKEARAEADRLGLPLINYGAKDLYPFIDEADINVDIEPHDIPNFVLTIPDSVPDIEGVYYVSHVLEHVNDPDSFIEKLTAKGPVYIIVPEVWDVIGWIHPDHKRMFTSMGVVNNPASFTIPLLLGGLILYSALK